jgi:hypothetical protein
VGSVFDSLREACAAQSATCTYRPTPLQTEVCNTFLCNATVNCSGEWGHKSLCSAECGDGNQSRVYHIATVARNNGTNATCSAADGTVEVTPCNVGPCPVHCAGAWGAWGMCSEDCGQSGHELDPVRSFSPSRPAAALFHRTPCNCTTILIAWGTLRLR